MRLLLFVHCESLFHLYRRPNLAADTSDRLTTEQPDNDSKYQPETTTRMSLISCDYYRLKTSRGRFSSDTMSISIPPSGPCLITQHVVLSFPSSTRPSAFVTR